MNITSLSPSMVLTYRQCPYTFYCSYCLKLPRMGSAYTGFGCAFHAMSAENMWQKVNSHEDLPVALLQDFFRDDLRYRDDVDWKDQEESLDDMTDQGVKDVKAYQETVAPGIQPKLVEHAWSMEVTNRPWVISGKIDLITTDEGIDELKTTGKKPVKKKDGTGYQPKPDHAFQVSTYAMARRAQTGKDVQGRLRYVLRGKGETISLDVELQDAQSIVSTFDNVAMSIQREWWPPFRSQFLCSRKYCSFWEQCEQDCGGEVKP